MEAGAFSDGSILPRIAATPTTRWLLRLRPDHRNEVVGTARACSKAQTIAKGHKLSQVVCGRVKVSHGAMMGSPGDALSGGASSRRDHRE